MTASVGLLSDVGTRDLSTRRRKQAGSQRQHTHDATAQSLRTQVRQKGVAWYASLFCWMRHKRIGAKSGISTQTASSVLLGGRRTTTSHTNEHNHGGQHE